MKPDELDTESEAKLRGHLKSDSGEERTGSSSYVPKDKAKEDIPGKVLEENEPAKPEPEK